MKSTTYKTYLKTYPTKCKMKIIYKQARKNAFTRHQKAKYIFLLATILKHVQGWESIMLSIFTQTLTFAIGQFTKGENLSIVQALFTSGASRTYLQTGCGAKYTQLQTCFWVGRSK